MNISIPTSVVAPNNSNGTHCTPHAQHVSLTVFLCLVYLVGLFLNGFSLWVFIFRMSKWSTGTILQFNLAMSDAIACPVTPLMAAYLTNGSNWEFGLFLCQLKIALLSAHVYGSTIFLTIISIHRYVMVVHYNRSCLLKRKSFVKKLCIGVWCFLMVKAIIYGTFLPVTKEEGHHQCLSIHQREHTDFYFVLNFLLFILGFIVPFMVSVVCYSRLANSVSRLNVNSNQGKSIKTKSLRMVGMCLIIFGFCFLPLNAARTAGVVVKKYYPKHCRLLLQVETFYYAAYVLAGVNCCLDPLIYFFGSSKFNRAFKRTLSIRRVQRERDFRSESDTMSYNVNRGTVYTVSQGI